MTSVLPIIIAGAPDPAPFAHGIKVGTTFRSSAISSPGVHADHGDLAGQAEWIYAQLSLALAQAGAAWRDVVKINHYHSGPEPTAAEWSALRQIVGRHVRSDQVAGMDLQIGETRSGCRLLVELIAEIGATHQLLGDKPLPDRGLAWAQGVRAGTKVYLSGRRHPGIGHHAGETLATQTAAIYEGFRGLLQQAGMARRDVVRVRQFIADEAADFNLVRAGRQSHVTAGYFTSTSVAIPRPIPASPEEAWLLTAELEAEGLPTIAISTSEVVDTPGVPHVIRVGNLLHLQAAIAVDESGIICHPGDVAGQTRHILAAFNAVLSAAGASWRDIIFSRVFCRHAEHLAIVKELEAAHASGTSYG